MRNTKLAGLFAIFTCAMCCETAYGQDRVFDWVPANQENVRLDPANYHTARTYHPSSPGANNHVDIRAQQPVTIFMAPEAEWNAVLQNPLNYGQLRRHCRQANAMSITDACLWAMQPGTAGVVGRRRGA